MPSPRIWPLGLDYPAKAKPILPSSGQPSILVLHLQMLSAEFTAGVKECRSLEGSKHWIYILGMLYYPVIKVQKSQPGSPSSSEYKHIFLGFYRVFYPNPSHLSRVIEQYDCCNGIFPYLILIKLPSPHYPFLLFDSLGNFGLKIPEVIFGTIPLGPDKWQDSTPLSVLP